MTFNIFCKVHVINVLKIFFRGKMVRKLFEAGNGWPLFLQKVIIELLKINPEKDTVEMQIENDILKIKKVYKKEDN